MSRYCLLIILSFSLFLGGCASVGPQPAEHQTVSFEGEDLMALQGLYAFREGRVEASVALFEELFDRTNKLEYLKEALKVAFSSGMPLGQLLDKALVRAPRDGDVLRIYVGHLLNEKEFDAAKEVMAGLLEEDKSVQNLTILGSIHFHLKEYDLALKYYDSIYAQEGDEEALLAIVDLLDVHLDRTNEAISYLETVRRMQGGCSKALCHRLVQIYGKTKNLDGLISTYKMLYASHKEEQYATKVVELLLFKRDFTGAIAFLEESGHDPIMLMDLYASKKAFDKSYEVAKKSYQETKQVEYLGRMAIYQYEQRKGNVDKVLLDLVIEKFEKVVKTLEDPLYLNYYGYLLIDHDIDISKGVELVKRALKKEPDSPYYIDSLAWGYYKLGRCQEAYALIAPIVGTINEPEVKEHYDAINACIRKGE